MADNIKELTEEKTSDNKKTEISSKHKLTLFADETEPEKIELIQEMLKEFNPEFPLNMERECKLTFEVKLDKNYCLNLYIFYDYKEEKQLTTKQLKLLFQ